VTNVEARREGNGEPIAEEAARAGLYAIIGRLFYDAPDESLLAAIAHGAGGEEPAEEPMGVALRDLRDACRAVSPAELKDEFDNLFVSLGKSEITPYTSHYVKEAAPGRHLVRLREHLAQWRLGRRNAASETEDHVAGVCDVMRVLVSDGYPLEQQRLFFNEFVYAAIVPFCDAIDRSPNAGFYRCVAQFTRAYLNLEKAAFELQQ